MARGIILASVAVLLLGIGPAGGSPAKGPYRIGDRTSRLNPGASCEFRATFRGNERACIIIEGDHKPVMNLKLKVTDAAGTEVASDTAGGDIIGASWYPAKTQEYVITITSDGKEYNDLVIVVK